jgi:hypothetical protein
MGLPGPITPDMFGRLGHRVFGWATAVLWGRIEMFGGRDLRRAVAVERGREVLRELGFIDIGAIPDAAGEMPHITTLMADMSSETVVRLVRIPGTPVIAEAYFDEAHPKVWSDAAHDSGSLIVLASARPLTEFTSLQRFLRSCWAAILPLAIIGFGGGPGTRPAAPEGSG